MPRDAVSRTANVGTVGTNGLKGIPRLGPKVSPTAIRLITVVFPVWYLCIYIHVIYTYMNMLHFQISASVVQFFFIIPWKKVHALVMEVKRDFYETCLFMKWNVYIPEFKHVYSWNKNIFFKSKIVLIENLFFLKKKNMICWTKHAWFYLEKLFKHIKTNIWLY